MIIIVLLILSYGIIPTYLYKLIKNHKRSNTIYLTFDDGPSDGTKRLLDLLKQYEIKATFFVVASAVSKETINLLLKDKHSIALHSLNHTSALLHLPYMVRRDFQTSIKIVNQFGVKPIYYRPPWGHFNLASLYYLKKNNLKLVLWDVMAEDWLVDTTIEEIANKLIKRTKGGIVCLHDGRSTTIDKMILALKIAIPYWISMGYKFDIIDNYEKNNH